MFIWGGVGNNLVNILCVGASPTSPTQSLSDTTERNEMKTEEQIIKSRPVFLHDWSESKSFGVIMDFEGVYMTKEEYEAKKAPYSNEEAWENYKVDAKRALDRYRGRKILFATYTYENYSGSAFVIFEEGGKLYEVNGSHCSCYGLENLWDPELVSLKELKNRVVKGNLGAGSYSGESFNVELKKFLGIKD